MPGFEPVKAQHAAPVIDPVGEVIAEGVKLFVRPVFAIDEQRLMRRHVEGLSQILEEGGYLRLKPGPQEFARHILVLIVMAGDDIQRAFAMTGVELLQLGDLHVLKQRATGGKFPTKERTEGVFRIDRFASTRTAAKPDDDHVGAFVGRPVAPRRSHCRWPSQAETASGREQPTRGDSMKESPSPKPRRGDSGFQRLDRGHAGEGLVFIQRFWNRGSRRSDTVAHPKVAGNRCYAS